MELDLKAPDHTTLSRRNKDVDVPSPTRAHDGALHLIVDSKGLKISGAGEWHAHRHKSSKAHRHCRKLHVGVDDDGFIVAAKLTKSSEDDPSTVPLSARTGRLSDPTFHSRWGLRYSAGVQAAR